MNIKILQDLGFTNTEIKVYLSLLNIGTTSAGKLVEATNIYRKNLYDALNKLIEKGLVTYVVENKKKIFQPKNPENLLKGLPQNNLVKFK